MSDNKWIDLRSDTVTQPTQQMREAMYQAQVGDDVYGDDPTVNQLEKKAAEMMGKEAALFVASGTMGNAVAVMSHTKRGDEIILSDTAHIVAHEVGGAAVLAQAFIRTLHFENGIFDAEQMAAAVRDSSNIHFPPTGLICVEEPLATGKVVPLNVLQEVYRMAQQKGIPVHMDGARIFNAATALGVDVKEIAACADSVRSGRLDAGRQQGVHRSRPQKPQDAWRRNAPVRIFGGSRSGCAGCDDQTSGRGPRKCPLYGTAFAEDAGSQPGFGCGGNQHGFL